MYKSPIEVVYEDWKIQLGENIVKGVQKCSIEVDKEQLLHALEYDRNQYQNGYDDGYVDGFDEAKKITLDVYKQVAGERNIAMEQLKEHGIPFGCIAPDVVEVVRCKDCKHCMLWNKPIDEHIGDCRFRYMYSDYPAFQSVRENDFCSHGERRDDGI